MDYWTDVLVEDLRDLIVRNWLRPLDKRLLGMTNRANYAAAGRRNEVIRRYKRGSFLKLIVREATTESLLTAHLDLFMRAKADGLGWVYARDALRANNTPVFEWMLARYAYVPGLDITSDREIGGEIDHNWSALQCWIAAGAQWMPWMSQIIMSDAPLAVIQWAFARGMSRVDCLWHAIARNDIDIVKCVGPCFNTLYGASEFYGAARRCNIEILEWLWVNGCPAGGNALSNAFARSPLVAFQWAHAKFAAFHRPEDEVPVSTRVLTMPLANQAWLASIGYTAHVWYWFSETPVTRIHSLS